MTCTIALNPDNYLDVTVKLFESNSLKQIKNYNNFKRMLSPHSFNAVTASGSM